MTISKGECGKLHTTVYRKTTDKNTVLKADSFHPKWLKDNIPFGQFQRLRRICDTDSEFEKQAKIMSNRFAQRGYEAKIVQSAYKKAQSTPRSELLMTNKQKSSKPEQIYFVTQYSSCPNAVKKIMHSNWNLIKSDPLLREVFPVPPQISFSRAPTLRDRLVPSHLSAPDKKTWLHRPVKGTFKCGWCKHCANVKECKQFSDFKTNKVYDIKSFINCNTMFVVY